MELGRGCGPLTTTNPSGRERAASRSWWRPNDRVRRDLVKPSRLGKKRDERDRERGRGRGRRRRFQRGRGCSWLSWEDTGAESAGGWIASGWRGRLPCHGRSRSIKDRTAEVKEATGSRATEDRTTGDRAASLRTGRTIEASARKDLSALRLEKTKASM